MPPWPGSSRTSWTPCRFPDGPAACNTKLATFTASSTSTGSPAPNATPSCARSASNTRPSTASIARPRSAEVAAGDGGTSERRQSTERAHEGGDQVDGAAGALDPAPDDQGGRDRGDPAVAVPHLGRADDVQHAGLVLQADEHHAAGGRRALPVGDQAGHGDLGTVRDRSEEHT